MNLCVSLFGKLSVFSRVINAELPKFDAAIEHFVPNLDEIELHKIPDGLVQALTRVTLMLQPEKM